MYYVFFNIIGNHLFISINMPTSTSVIEDYNCVSNGSLNYNRHRAGDI